MWSRPIIETQIAVEQNAAEDLFQKGGLWTILLFRKADTNIADALTQNWEIFNTKLGPQAHMITMLDIEMTKMKRGRLVFPENYESQVGVFCHSLNIDLRNLPAVVVLNSPRSSAGVAPHWSIKNESLKSSSDGLVTIVDEMRKATLHPVPSDIKDREAWIERAADGLISNLSRHAVGDFLKLTMSNIGLPALKTALEKLLGKNFSSAVVSRP